MEGIIAQKRREDFEDEYCESTNLSPCPFCGSEARFVNTHDGGCCVECSKCMASSRAIHPDKQDPNRELAEAWNSRYTDDQYESDEYQKHVESMVQYCHCEPADCRPCDGVLAGGLCDGKRDDPDDYESEDE